MCQDKPVEGTIALIIGPQSSGKSTFISNLIKQIPSIITINRKEVLQHVNAIATNQFLVNILNQIKSTTGEKITTFHNLNSINLTKLTIQKKEFFKLKNQVINIVNSNTFNKFILHEAFKTEVHR